MLNVLLARTQRSCCSGVVGLSPGQEGPGGFEQSILHMFAQEWSASGEKRPLTRVVILDESPQAQYLYPEFLLFQRLFESAGIDRSEEHTSELQSLMRISYAVFCLKKKKKYK